MDIIKRKKSKDEDEKPEGAVEISVGSKSKNKSKKITITNWEDDTAKEVEIPTKKKKKPAKALVKLDDSGDDDTEVPSENDEWHKLDDQAFDDDAEIAGEGEEPDPDVIEAIESWHQIDVDEESEDEAEEDLEFDDEGSDEEELESEPEAEEEETDDEPEELEEPEDEPDDEEEVDDPGVAVAAQAVEDDDDEPDDEEDNEEDEVEEEVESDEPPETKASEAQTSKVKVEVDLDEDDEPEDDEEPEDDQRGEEPEEPEEPDDEPEDDDEEEVDEEDDEEAADEEVEDEPEPIVKLAPKPQPKKPKPLPKPKPVVKPADELKPSHPPDVQQANLPPAAKATISASTDLKTETAEDAEAKPVKEEPKKKPRFSRKRSSVGSAAAVEVVSKRPRQTEPEPEPTPEPEPEPEKPEEKLAKAEPKLEAAEVDSPKKTKKPKRTLFMKIRYMIYGAIIVVLSMLVMSQSRDVVLNAAGLTTSARVAVIDQATGLPLKQVEVQVESYSFETSEQGDVTINGLPYGEHDISLIKPGYEIVTLPLKTSLGSGGALDVSLVPNGVQTEVEVVDWLSGEPIAGAAVASLKNSVYSDAGGQATLSTPNNPLTINVSAEGYKATEIKVADESTFSVALVPSTKHYFVADNDGSLDLSRVNADGSGEEIVLEGEPGEDEKRMRYSVSPDGSFIALVSLRDETLGSDGGQRISGLYVVDPGSQEAKLLDSSSDIELVGWAGNILVYLAKTEGEAGDSSKQYRISTVGTAGTPTEIASANFFNDIAVVGDKIFYVPSEAHQQSSSSSLYVSNVDGLDKRPITNQAVWSIVRTGPVEIAFGANQEWFTLNAETDELVGGVEPTNEDSLLYSASPDGGQLAWIDLRLDGVETLSVVSLVDGQNTVSAVANLEGMIGPPRWLGGDHLVARVVEGGQYADYVFHVGSGSKQKITQTSSVSGIDRWNYYY